jgi:hypothetical protein
MIAFVFVFFTFALLGQVWLLPALNDWSLAARSRTRMPDYPQQRRAFGRDPSGEAGRTIAYLSDYARALFTPSPVAGAEELRKRAVRRLISLLAYLVTGPIAILAALQALSR